MSTPRPRLGRPHRPPSIVSLTPLVDVLLILVVFFLVTSTYLDLDMIPMVETVAAPDSPVPEAPAQNAPGASAAPAIAGAMLVRIGADGRAALGGGALDAPALAAAVRARLAARPDTAVLLLPSPLAPTQALVDALGAVADGGATSARVVRLAPAGG